MCSECISSCTFGDEDKFWYSREVGLCIEFYNNT